MIVYGCITNKLKKEGIQDISTREANEILKANKIILKSLPGYGNDELKKKKIWSQLLMKKQVLMKSRVLKYWIDINRLLIII